MYKPCHDARRAGDPVAIAIALALLFFPILVPACGPVGGALSESIDDNLPSLFEESRFRVREGPCSFDATNLYDRINGAAPAYMACGFEFLTTFTLFDEARETEIAVDIFDMGRSRNAFGIYSLERDRSGSGDEFGCGSYRSDDTLFFWQDRYYIKLVAFDIGPHVGDSLAHMARVISEATPRSGSRPAEFDLFPDKDRLPHTERFIAEDWLGQNYLSGGYTVDYGAGEREYTIGLIKCFEEEESKQDFEKLRAFVSRGREVVDLSTTVGAEAFSGSVSYYGPLVAARRGAHLVVILGLDTEGSVAILTAMVPLLDKL